MLRRRRQSFWILASSEYRRAVEDGRSLGPDMILREPIVIELPARLAISQQGVGNAARQLRVRDELPEVNLRFDVCGREQKVSVRG